MFIFYLVIGYWLLVTWLLVNWLLVTGYWLIGYWLLGYWLLVTGYLVTGVGLSDRLGLFKYLGYIICQTPTAVNAMKTTQSLDGFTAGKLHEII